MYAITQTVSLKNPEVAHLVATLQTKYLKEKRHQQFFTNGQITALRSRLKMEEKDPGLPKRVEELGMDFLAYNQIRIEIPQNQKESVQSIAWVEKHEGEALAECGCGAEQVEG